VWVFSLCSSAVVAQTVKTLYDNQWQRVALSFVVYPRSPTQSSCVSDEHVCGCLLCCAVCRAVCVAAGTGGLRLLNAVGLSGLLQLLSDRDMPVDMLQLLVNMAEDGCRWVQGSPLVGIASQPVVPRQLVVRSCLMFGLCCTVITP
jgi:hypothetical protein